MVSNGDGVRDSGGKFVKGHPGGPGRPARRTPLHRAITPDRAEELWEERYEIARNSPDDDAKTRAAEFILRHVNGQPPPAQPDVPAVPWGKIRSIEDVRAAIPVVFSLHESGEVDGTGLEFLMRLLERAAKLFETIDVAGQVREIQEQIEQMRARGMMVGAG